MKDKGYNRQANSDTTLKRITLNEAIERKLCVHDSFTRTIEHNGGRVTQVFYIVGPNQEAPTAYYYRSYPTVQQTISTEMPELISMSDKWTYGLITDVAYIKWLEKQLCQS